MRSKSFEALARVKARALLSLMRFRSICFIALTACASGGTGAVGGNGGDDGKGDGTLGPAELQMLLEIQTALADGVVLPHEAMKMIAAAGDDPSPEAISIAQRFVAAQQGLISSSESFAGDDYVSLGMPNALLGGFVSRYALGAPIPRYPAPSGPTILTPGTHVHAADLATWMQAHGITGLRSDVLLYAFEVWQVSHANSAVLATLPPGTRIAVGEYDYVQPAPVGDEAELAPILAYLGADRVLDDKYPLSAATETRPPLPGGDKTLVFATELATFAPGMGFTALPSFDDVVSADDVISPPLDAWIEALDPSTSSSVGLRLVSELLDLTTQNDYVDIETSYWNDSDYDGFVDPQTSGIISSRYQITNANIRASMWHLVGTTFMINGAAGQDGDNDDQSVGIVLVDANGAPSGRASLRVFDGVTSEYHMPFNRPRTRFRLPDGTYTFVDMGYTFDATEPSSYYVGQAREMLEQGQWPVAPQSMAPATIAELAGPLDSGTPPQSLEDAIAMPVPPAPVASDRLIASYGSHTYYVSGNAIVLEDGTSIAPPGIDFWSAVPVVAPHTIYWLASQDLRDDPTTAIYDGAGNARGIIAFDLDSRTWELYQVPLLSVAPDVIPNAHIAVESSTDGDTIVLTYDGTMQTTLDLRGVTPVPVGRGYFTQVLPPYGDGTLYQ
ncbi:MAG TPA: hypothetical protein VMJ10_27190 [Kofleriaceae bacterium]|nr:hypothetical protein [Kofleriaceae bacterium]